MEDYLTDTGKWIFKNKELETRKESFYWMDGDGNLYSFDGDEFVKLNKEIHYISLWVTRRFRRR